MQGMQKFARIVMNAKLAQNARIANLQTMR